MKVSVVLTAYNEEKYIESCIKSILDQSLPADEIILVDNNSSDNTVSIAQKYPITISYEKQQGTIPARNHGFDMATSEIIARTDADTQVPHTWIEQITSYMSTHACDGLLGGSYYRGSPKNMNAPLFLSFAEAFKKIFGVYPLIGPNMAVTKSMWQKIKPFLCTDSNEVHEDIDVAIHIKDVGGQVCFDPTNVAWTSTRRLVQKPQSFFLEYPHRLIKMRKTHL